MRLFTYGNSGGIDCVIKNINNNPKTYNSIADVLNSVLEENKGFINLQDLSIKYYCKDERIGKTVYIITTDRYGDEDYIREYFSPRYVRYLIDLDEVLK